MNIGEKFWYKGDECTVTTEPYTMHGAEWFDAVNESGKTFAVVSPKQASENSERNRNEWKEQQAQFAKLERLNHE